MESRVDQSNKLRRKKACQHHTLTIPIQTIHSPVCNLQSAICTCATHESDVVDLYEQLALLEGREGDFADADFVDLGLALRGGQRTEGAERDRGWQR
jgi:hypothetical protein